ncbi:hypothetical protein BG011_006397 [Mortierella polycephala]|uniref:Tudor domain-containing protein n=1 Tax=Mortierella polycephala TaxID=41804 RepID=A0A9P6PV53_9FUNG|nr:hypothetical protein BG011_006397 [Mortierella polycephala]
MDASDLISYKEQVATIETALLADPANEELLTLKTELLELISLTETLLQEEKVQQQQQQELSATTSATSTAATIASPVSVGLSSVSATDSPNRSAFSPQSGTGIGSGLSTPTNAGASSIDKSPPASNQPIYVPPAPLRNWSVGDRCRALYAADGKYYDATIRAIASGGQVISVEYKGYANSPSATLGPQDLKPVYDHKKNPKGSGGVGAVDEADKGQKKRGAEGAAGDGSFKKKKGSGAVNEQVQKQMAWQNFAKGGAKKAKGTILKKSIFATPDNPEGKVGVVGSGKGMTQFQARGKHVYGNSPQSN